MSAWRPQIYRKTGRETGAAAEVLQNATVIGTRTISLDKDLPPVFTLRHLSYLTGVEYGFLRAVVTRNLKDPYKVFRIAQSRRESKEQSYRIICVPDPALMQLQRWIDRRILSRGHAHEACFAYSPGASIRSAAELHCGCRWMIKLDVRQFFESISEISVYRVFRGLGYQPLVAFELARLCTRLGARTGARTHGRWLAKRLRPTTISKYYNRRMGHLPQGAPTSPLLSNLALVNFDEAVTKIAMENGLVYTRYADDLCFSTEALDFTRKRAAHVIGLVFAAMGGIGLSPNVSKTRVISPGARKVVLGLLVDGAKPRLSREFRSRLRQHIYYLRHADIGPAFHAANRGFVSVLGLRHHVEGLIAYAIDIEPYFADQCDRELVEIEWPL
jgi:RNA-directed DNA polymerase